VQGGLQRHGHRLIQLAEDGQERLGGVGEPAVLGDKGYAVTAVGDGEAAWALLAAAAARAGVPDLVVADVMMPRLDGPGLVRRLRADPALARVPVLLTSARWPTGDWAGLDRVAFLPKPFGLDELLAAVAAALGG
jgi:DNA-binding response OmpR family regulator